MDEPAAAERTAPRSGGTRGRRSSRPAADLTRMKDPAEIARRLEELQQKIGIAFRNVALLQEALSHSSFANENPSISPHDNERLEYLGDAVLQLISAEYLFKGRPGAEEGEMTQVRSSMVNTQALAALSEDLGLGEYLLLGKGIARGGGRNLRSLLANAFEAVLGAIFLDQGYDAAYHYCMERFRALPDADVPENFKGRLQHLVQERFGVTPVYDAIGARAQSGRMREYTAVVYAGGDPLGTGHGRTKQVAEQTAAKEAIRKLLDEMPAPAAESAPTPAPMKPRETLEAAAALEESAAMEEPVESPPAAAEVEPRPEAASPSEPAPPPAPAPAPAPEPAPVPAAEPDTPEEAAVSESEAVERVGGGWRSRREVAERAAAERRRPRPEPEPAAPAQTPLPVAEEQVAPEPPPPPVQVPPSRQFGAPAAEVEVELVLPPAQVDHLVAAPATSLVPAQAASSPSPPRQFGQPAPEPKPEPQAGPQPAPRPRRRTTRASTSASSEVAAVEAPPTEKPVRARRTSRRTTPAAEAQPGSEPAAEEPKPPRRRSTRARRTEPTEPEPAPSDATPDETAADRAPAPRRRTSRRRAAPREAGPDTPA